MVDIRNQFSLDWLGGSSSDPAEKTSGPDEATLFFYGRPLVENLRNAPEREMRLYELAKQSVEDIPKFEFKECLSVVNRLAHLGVLRIVEKDPGGNHLVRLIK